MIEREQQIDERVFNKIPAFVKETVSPDAIRQFALSILESQTPTLPRFGEMTTSGFGRIFGPVSPFNGFQRSGFFASSDIPLNVLDMMRRDYQVALGMAIVKFPITQLNFTIACKNPTIREFVRLNLRPKWASFVQDALRSLDFGFTAFEKVWESAKLSFDPGINARKVKDRDFIVLRKLKPLQPLTVTVRTDDNGNFEGINQNRFGKQVILPRNKSMMITNDEEFNNFFGRSRLVAAYEPWYWKQITTQFFLRYTERFSIPPYKVSYPLGKSRWGTGDEVDNAAIAMDMATALSSLGNVAVPSMTDDKGGRKWNIEAMDQGKLNVKPQDLVGFWDMKTLRGLLIPDKETLSAMDEETASEVYLSTLAAIVKQIEEKVNREIVAPLVLWNFSEEERMECRVNIDDIDFKKRSEMRKLMSKIIDLSATFIKNEGGVPFDVFPSIQKILDTLDVPYDPITIHMPRRVDSEGNEVKAKPKPKNNNSKKGPEPGEKTSGNQSREGRDGEVRDDGKQENRGDT